VTLDDPFCPHCGAEFEEEEVEEIAVEETIVEEVPAPEEEEVEVEVEEEAEEVEAEEVAEEEVEEEVEEEAEEEAKEEAKVEPVSIVTGLTDMRVYGIMLFILGIFGIQIAIFIKEYWKFVPSISGNLGIYFIIGLLIVIVGFVTFSLLKSSAEKGKEHNPLLPAITLAIFIFGIVAILMIIAGQPLSDLIGNNQAALAIVFVVIALIGIALFLMGQKKTDEAAKTAEAA
jgi:uncharacterized membrane protein